MFLKAYLPQWTYPTWYQRQESSAREINQDSQSKEEGEMPAISRYPIQTLAKISHRDTLEEVIFGRGKMDYSAVDWLMLNH